LIDVYTRKIELQDKSGAMKDYRSVFCGYLKHLIHLMRNDGDYIGIYKVFDCMTHFNKDFAESITIWLKESLIKYVRTYPDFLRKIGYQE